MLKNERAQSRREREKRRKLERIEAAARQLFAERGFESTTTRAIAEAADIGAGTLFVYFPEKLDLLIRIYRVDLERVTGDVLGALPDDLPLLESCMRVFDAVYGFYESDPVLARTFIKELMFLSAERQREMFRLTVRFLDQLGQRVAAAQRRGEVRADIGRPLVAHQIFGLYYWGLVNWLGGQVMNRQQATALLRMQLGLLIEGLAPRTAQQGDER